MPRPADERPLTRAEPAVERAAGPVLLAIGGIDYDPGPGAAREPGSARTGFAPRDDALRIRGERAWQPGFEYLPGSAAEVNALADSFERSFPDATAVVLTKQEASRASFERLAPGATFLHLATHACFAPESIPSMRDESSDRGPRSTIDPRAQVRGFVPMLLCGLAFAGANRTRAGAGEPSGLLTAEELAGLDLSACESNVGVRRAGQGIASLQSALHAAGARTSIASLWGVPDAATKELMQHFYRALWLDKMSKPEALWQAKLALRAERDAQCRPVYGTRDWAGWVLSGDV